MFKIISRHAREIWKYGNASESAWIASEQILFEWT